MPGTMNCLTVWRFATSQDAETALGRLQEQAAVDEIHVGDAALVTWTARQRKPSLHELGAVVGPGALWRGFWGVLLALIFLVPIAGPTFGAAAGAFAGGLSDFGVEDDFVKQVRDAVTPGTSALFLIGDRTSVDQIAAAFDGLEVALLRSDLSVEQARRLRDALGDESTQSVSSAS